jgi:hypothetical protein
VKSRLIDLFVFNLIIFIHQKIESIKMSSQKNEKPPVSRAKFAFHFVAGMILQRLSKQENVSKISDFEKEYQTTLSFLAEDKNAKLKFPGSIVYN